MGQTIRKKNIRPYILFGTAKLKCSSCSRQRQLVVWSHAIVAKVVQWKIGSHNLANTILILFALIPNAFLILFAWLVGLSMEIFGLDSFALQSLSHEINISLRWQRIKTFQGDIRRIAEKILEPVLKYGTLDDLLFHVWIGTVKGFPLVIALGHEMVERLPAGYM